MGRLKPASEKTALILQGGGARGAYHVGTLKAIAEITKARISPFHIVCGSSVGAINAASIAVMSRDFQAATRHLETLWRALHCDSIYETGGLPLFVNSSRWAATMMFGFLGLRSTGGFLDYAPLRRLLESEFNRPQLERAIKTGALHALAITASSYDQGNAVSFYEGVDEIRDWTRARRMGRRTKIGPEHLLASSALSFAFPPVRIENEYFGDGALRSNSPLSPAIHTGAERILVIGTRDTKHERPPDDTGSHPPTFGEVAGHALDILFNDNLELDYERMERINKTLSLLTDEARKKTPLKPIRPLLLTPSQDVRDLARPHAQDLPRAVRILMRSAGAWRKDGRLESYLMFEPAYVGSLIDLGHADTLARADEIEAFFVN
ncbi:NTE family protein [Roseivivax lentus]|uniref:NTE family protein n=1 Tax=Roseivivax lentus TaxID=633194 RepID=A0A1N7NB45_9RHOB|nr:patatin-like phospholipase family protein [Roseivivax lentus]SIS95536.1 NTE family protein [Roseivivax lentus]